jgi:hypothetical protein
LLLTLQAHSITDCPQFRRRSFESEGDLCLAEEPALNLAYLAALQEVLLVSLHQAGSITSHALCIGDSMILSRTLLLLLPLACSAQIIQGNVQNGTTGKPAAAHQVILFTASGEQARTTTNENGMFQIEPSVKLAPHSPAILQVIHDGVEYFQSVRPGQRTNVKIYDASDQVKRISDYLSILQFEVKGKLLQVTELHAFSNSSNPPTTRVDANNVVLSIPEGSQVRPATVSGPDGGTVKLPLVSIPGKRTQYRIDFPMKPGLTKYAVSYDVPYSGDLVFRRQAQYPIKRVGVIVPASMRFHSLGAKAFHAVVDQPGSHEHVLDGLDANERFAFALSGTGALAHSFRPLTPGEPPRSTGSKTLMSAPWPRPGYLLPGASPARARPFLAEYQVILAIGSVMLAGLLLWRVMPKKARRV